MTSTPYQEALPLHDPTSWWTKYVFSQDHKVIAIQYTLTAVAVGMVALAMSWMMRLQLGFPGTFSFIDPSTYYQLVTMHGMIMVIYLLTAIFLGGFGNFLIPLMVGARDMVFPFVNMLSYWAYLLSVLVLMSSLFVPGGPTGAGWTLYPPQAILPGTPGSGYGIVLMLISLILFIVAATMGGLELCNHCIAGTYPRHDPDAHAAGSLGNFNGNRFSRCWPFPALFVAGVMMLFDRLLETSFLHALRRFHGAADELQWR